MPEMRLVRVNGREIRIPSNATVAAAMIGAGELMFRQSVSGEPRAPLCGMGVCFECRVTIDGCAHVRSCQVLVREGMEIHT
jgi:D-hydroxyproline dehydrogenase subunit gamma